MFSHDLGQGLSVDQREPKAPSGAGRGPVFGGATDLLEDLGYGVAGLVAGGQTGPGREPK